MSCKYCGDAVIEIKCRFGCREASLKEAVEEKFNLCLGRDDDGPFFLKKDHAYFYQVQAQILLCKIDFCDFIIYSKRDIVILRILPEHEFIKAVIADVTTLFKFAVLPEIVGKYFSKSFQERIACEAPTNNLDTSCPNPETTACRL